MNSIFDALEKVAGAGIEGVTTYLGVPILIILVPTFLFGGAITVFSPREKILQYFGPNAKKRIAYPLASFLGLILAVCSCGIIPLFAGIYRAGAGIGPSTTLLFAGPAINLLAIVYTANVLGAGLGVVRGAAAILMSIYIGLVMEALFRREEKAAAAPTPAGGAEASAMSPGAAPSAAAFPLARPSSKMKVWPIFVLFILFLFSMLTVAGTVSRRYFPESRCSCAQLTPWVDSLPLLARLAAALLFLGAALAVVRAKSGGERTKMWLLETLTLVRMVVPFVLVGAFLAGLIREFVPQRFVYSSFSDNSLGTCLLASVVGAFSYFATLTEVPIVGSLMQLYMSKGAALALLLAGPAVSLPSMIAIARVIGVKKAFSYIALVVVLTALVSCVVANFDAYVFQP